MYLYVFYFLDQAARVYLKKNVWGEFICKLTSRMGPLLSLLEKN